MYVYSDKAKTYKDVTFFKHMRWSLIQIRFKKKMYINFPNFPKIAPFFSDF